MLPRPSTSSFSSRRSSNWLELHVNRLLGRARVTNLAVWLLTGSLLLSLALNFRLWASHRSTSNVFAPKYTETSLQRTSFPSHLIIVAGHAIWKGCHGSDWDVEDSWILHAYQKGDNSSIETFYAHIRKGVELLGSDTSAVLLFSGGVTRPSHPVQSEAQSYLALAMQNRLVLPPHLLPRVFTEDYALDSFQNLLFSIMRYHELASAALASRDGQNGGSRPRRALWPEKITVVGFEMKRRRFVELHRAALKWPEERFEYIGVDLADDAKRAQAEEGENLNGYQPYTRDLYGCTGELARKRASRNPFARFHPYYTTNPELAVLLDWCPAAMRGRYDTVDSQIFRGSLPWD